MAGNGTKKMDAKEILKRLVKLKAHVDKGNETSITTAANKYIKSSHFVKALLSRSVVHKNKDGTIRWNGLAVNLRLAQAIVDGGHAYNKKYWEDKNKAKTGNVSAKSTNKTPVDKDRMEEEVDSVTGIEASELKRLRKILDSGVGIENKLSEISAMHADVKKALNAFSTIRYDMNRMIKQMYELHLDHIEKNQIIDTLTQTEGS